MMNEYEMYATYNDQGLQLAMLQQQQHYMPPQAVSITPLTTTASAAASNSTQRQSVKALTKSETPAERSTRRKQATQREKRRMEKLNHCIEDIKQIVCPEMKAPTKAKILREAINRIEYLERITQQMLAKYDGKVELALPGFKESLEQSPPTDKPISSPGTYYQQNVSSPDSGEFSGYSSPVTQPPITESTEVKGHQESTTVTLPSVASITAQKGATSADYYDESTYTQYVTNVTPHAYKLEPNFYEDTSTFY